MLLNREEMLEILNASAAQVTFIKVNGERRVMNCTRNPKLIEECPSDDSEGGRVVNENVVNVWDLDKKDWRSFRLDSIESVMYDD